MVALMKILKVKIITSTGNICGVVHLIFGYDSFFVNILQ